MTSLHRAAIPCAAFLGLTSLAAARTPSFDLTGVNGSRVYSLSADGRAGAGWTSPSGVGFTWTRAGGVANISELPSGLVNVNAISGDGATVAGAHGNAAGANAFLWSGPGTYRDIGALPGLPVAIPNSASNDASVVVGISTGTQMGSPTRAFYWSDATGMVGLGTTRPGHSRSVANAVSRDGRIVVGTSDNGATSDAFTWTLAGGFSVLPPLPGSPDGYTFARGTNFDGSVVVGESGTNPGSSMVMWRNGETINLGVPFGSSGGAIGVNDDGTVVTGYIGTPNGNGPAVWTPGRGTEFLSTYLLSNGVGLPQGWSLTYCYAVSGDGLTFAGYATSTTTGNVQGFVATVPSPTGVFAFTSVALLSIPRCRR